MDKRGEPGTPTTTVTLAVTGPNEFVAVSVYVVVAVGFTCVDPEGATFPKPVIVTVLALLTAQLRVEAPPGDIVVGFAVNETIVGGALWGVMVVGSLETTEPVVPPPLAVATLVNDEGALAATFTVTVIGGWLWPAGKLSPRLQPFSEPVAQSQPDPTMDTTVIPEGGVSNT
jgi:hypothetical protein